ISDAAAIAADGSVTYSAHCTLSAGASGTLANIATVSYANDPVAGNNSATDSDTITAATSDVSISVSDGAASANAGASVGYSIVATNPAAFAISTVGVADAFPGTLSGCSWTCVASAGGACQSPSGSGDIATTTNSIAASGTVTFSATCALSAAATGTLADTATASYA